MARINAGKVAEYACATELLRRGYTPLWPSVEDEPFDIVATKNGTYARIQVKSSSQAVPTLRLSIGNKRPYTKDEVDFILLWAEVLGEWFIIPIEELDARNIYLNTKSKKCKWNKFREAWDLLGKT